MILWLFFQISLLSTCIFSWLRARQVGLACHMFL